MQTKAINKKIEELKLLLLEEHSKKYKNIKRDRQNLLKIRRKIINNDFNNNLKWFDDIIKDHPNLTIDDPKHPFFQLLHNELKLDDVNLRIILKHFFIQYEEKARIKEELEELKNSWISEEEKERLKDLFY